MDITVVGGGISGAASARALVDAGHDVRILEAADRLGGRLAEMTVAGRLVDIGASYFTVSDSRFRAVVDDWRHRGLAREWTDTFAIAGAGGISGTTTDPMRYASPHGLSALVRDLAVGVPVERRRVRRVELGPRVDDAATDAAVLAIPDAKAKAVFDDAPDPLDADPAVAVVLRYARRCWPADLHGAFVNDHPVLTFIADDGDRKGDGAPVLVAHTTALYAATSQNPIRVSNAVAEILEFNVEPIEIAVKEWGPVKPRSTHDAPFWLEAGIGICGDHWGGGTARVESAWLSGTDLAGALS